MHPYATYARYVEAIGLALDSRREGSDPARLLRQALFMLEGAISHMREAAYGMHLPEATRFRRGIKAALTKHGAAGASG
jgi:hypothetical protein